MTPIEEYENFDGMIITWVKTTTIETVIGQWSAQLRDDYEDTNKEGEYLNVQCQ